MGMYDELKCERPLADGTALTCVFQTKDLDCSLSMFTITKDGALICDEWHYEETPQAEKPYPNAPKGSIDSFIGSMTRVCDKEDAPQTYSGAIEFYGDDGCFVAVFKNGKMVGEITRLDD